MHNINSHGTAGIFGVNIRISPFDQSSLILRQLIDEGNPSYICIINVHVLVTALRDRYLNEIINAADWSFPDGVPLVWYAKHLLGLRHAERVAGPSLMIKCFNELRERKHFFYGGSRGTLERLVQLAKREYPNLNIVGSISPPFRPLRDTEKLSIISHINRISPDIIWVSLGAPKQEIWMRDMKKEIKKGVMIGVGAAFDYFVGNIKRPPIWIRRSGLEWLCRLCQDPIRLSKRYFITNSLFLFYLARELVSKNSSRSKWRI